jgi:hypothetical protein
VSDNSTIVNVSMNSAKTVTANFIRSTIGCFISLSPSAASIGVIGGNVNVGVTLSGSDCTWSASNPPSWVNITNGSGKGNGTLSFTMPGNQSSSTARTGTISISTQTSQTSLIVTQAGSTCSYSLLQSSQGFVSSGGAGTATVAVQPGCPWTADNGGLSWVSIDSGSLGPGEGTVKFTVAPNGSASPRSGTLTIATQTFAVTQAAGGNDASCTVAAPAPAQAALEGRTELLSDLSFTCTGFAAPITATVRLNLNATVTNLLSGTDTLDAMLVGGGSSVNGHLAGFNSVYWTGVTLGTGSNTFKITKVRADTSLVQGTAITGSLTIFITPSIPVLYTAQSTSCGAPPTNAEIMACVAPTLAFQSGSPMPPSGGAQTAIQAVFQETAAGLFKSTAGAQTRFRLVVSNVPSNVSVYAPINAIEGGAQLYSADSSGSGGSPITGSPLGGPQQLTVTGGVATATWVVAASDPSQAVKWTFPVILTNATSANLSTIQFSGSLAPVSSVAVADATAPIPRYRDFLTPPAFSAMRLTLKTVFVNNSPVVTWSVVDESGSASTGSSAAMAARATPGPTVTVGGQSSTGQVLAQTTCPTVPCNGQYPTPQSSSPQDVAGQVSTTNPPANQNSNTVVTYVPPNAGCTFVLTPASASFPASETDGNTLTVNASSLGCPQWTATSPVNWVVITAGSPGFRTADVTYNVAANPSSAARSTSLTVAGQQFPINQAGAVQSCTLALTPSTASVGSNGASVNVSVTTDCAWTASGAPAWVTLTNGSGTGSGTLSFTVAANAGAARSGTITVGSQTLTINQAAGAAAGGPQTVSVDPAYSTTAGFTYNFTFTFSHPNGWQSISVADVLVNGALDGTHACYIAVLPSGPSSGTVLLVDDAGHAGGPFQTLALPGIGTAQNSQCSLSGTGGSIWGTGNTLRVTLPITFKSAFAGNKVIYLSAGDGSGVNSGWHAMGTCAVAGSVFSGPSVGGVTPGSGTGAGTFVFTFNDLNGWQDLGIVNILINNALDGTNACFLAYSRQYNALYLVNDNGTGLVSGALTNSQCSVTTSGSYAVGSGNTLTLTLNISFTATFAGNRIVYMAARSNGDVLNSGWQAVGVRALQ